MQQRFNENILVSACEELITQFNDFWVLTGLTDDSYEEGIRNSHFHRRVNRFESVGLADPTLQHLKNGTNGNLKDILEKQNPEIGHVTRTVGKGQDLTWSRWDGQPAARVEVKLVYDCTMTKYYPSVAADRHKLMGVRQRPSADDLFLVVFFSSLPKFSRPAGQWSSNAKKSVSRASYTNRCGVKNQYSALSPLIKERPMWPADTPLIRSLHEPTAPAAQAIESFFSLFSSAVGWKFDLSTALKDAEVGVAIWQIPA